MVPERALPDGDVSAAALGQAVEGLGRGHHDGVREHVGECGEQASGQHDRPRGADQGDASRLEGDRLACAGRAPERHEAAEEGRSGQQVLEQVAGADLEQQRGDAVLGLDDVLHVQQDLDHEHEQHQHGQNEGE